MLSQGHEGLYLNILRSLYQLLTFAQKALIKVFILLHRSTIPQNSVRAFFGMFGHAWMCQASYVAVAMGTVRAFCGTQVDVTIPLTTKQLCT